MILPYTIGTNGALQSLVGGQVDNSGTVANPGPMIVDHQGKFLYLANMGPNLTPTSEASSVSAFFIDPTTGRLTSLSSGATSTYPLAQDPLHGASWRTLRTSTSIPPIMPTAP